MPVTWRALADNVQAVATGNVTTATATLPADLKGGDTCYAYIQFNPTTGSPTSVPAGWTQLGTDIVFSTNNHAQIYKHTAAGATGAASSEASGTVTFGGYGTQRVALAVAAGRTDGTEQSVSLANGTDTLTPSNAPGLVATRPHGADRLVFVGQRSSSPSTSISNSSGLTQAMACGTGSGAVSVAVGVDNPGVANGSAMGTSSWSQSPGTAVGWIETTIAVGIATNTAPSANAGPDQTVHMGVTVTLDGSGSSDPDGDTITYAWSQTSGTTVSLSSATAQMPTFTSPPGTTGTLVFSLTVTDSHGASSTADTVTITVADQAPTANAGADQTDVEPFATIHLDGSGSTDPDSGDALTYFWTQTGGPTAPLSDAIAQKPTVTAPGTVAGATLQYTLRVTDSHGTSSTTDSVTITVLPHTLFLITASGPVGRPLFAL